jgi:hypothetical protein
MSLSESQAERVIGAFAAGADWALAARVINIPRSTLMDWISKDPSLQERVDEARAQADEIVIKSLYTEATVNRNVTAMIFWLKNRRPKEWRDRRELDIYGTLQRDPIATLKRSAEVAREEIRKFNGVKQLEGVIDVQVLPMKANGNGANGNGHR